MTNEEKKKNVTKSGVFFRPFDEMGLLTEGHTLTWNEIKDLREQLRSYALEQLIRIYRKYQDRQGDAFTWGDEVKLSTRQPSLSIALFSLFSRSN